MILITIGEKKSGYFKVFANDKLLGLFSENSIKKLKINNNKRYPLEYVKKIKLIGAIKYTQKKALILLKMKDYSEFELSNKLKRYGSPHIVKFVISQMKKKGFVNDVRYAKNLAYKLLIKKSKSKKLTTLEILKKGISKDVAENAINDLKYDPQKIIKNLILKKYKNKLNNKESKKKLIANLIHLGYDYYDIKKTISQME